MPEQRNYTSIGPLDKTAAKEAWPLIGLILLTMVVTSAALWVAGNIANAL